MDFFNQVIVFSIISLQKDPKNTRDLCFYLLNRITERRVINFIGILDSGKKLLVDTLMSSLYPLILSPDIWNAYNASNTRDMSAFIELKDWKWNEAPIIEDNSLIIVICVRSHVTKDEIRVIKSVINYIKYLKKDYILMTTDDKRKNTIGDMINSYIEDENRVKYMSNYKNPNYAVSDLLQMIPLRFIYGLLLRAYRDQNTRI